MLISLLSSSLSTYKLCSSSKAQNIIVKKKMKLVINFSNLKQDFRKQIPSCTFQFVC